MTATMWTLLLSALLSVEQPRTAEQARIAIAREGAYGSLQIRKDVLEDVNHRYGTKITLQDCAKSQEVSKQVCMKYIKMYKQDTSYEAASKCWNGGPEWKHKKNQPLHNINDYWSKVQKRLPANHR